MYAGVWAVCAGVPANCAGELNKFLRERSERHFVYLRRQMDPDEARRVVALGAPGVFSQREYRRYYPAGEVAGHVVGFALE